MIALDRLLDSDPAIRRQVLRDLVDAPSKTSRPSVHAASERALRHDQKTVNKSELSFHPEAAKRFDERTLEILTMVQGLRPVPKTDAHQVDLHPAHVIQPGDILAAPKFTFHHDEA